MRTTPATATEVDAWLTVLHHRGHLHRTQAAPDGTWTVQRGRHSHPWTLHHPVLTMDWIEKVLLEAHQHDTETNR